MRSKDKSGREDSSALFIGNQRSFYFFSTHFARHAAGSNGSGQNSV